MVQTEERSTRDDQKTYLGSLILHKQGDILRPLDFQILARGWVLNLEPCEVSNNSIVMEE